MEMPRFLGLDYYLQDFTAKRDLSAHAALTVPHCFKEENMKNMASFYDDIYGNLQGKITGELMMLQESEDLSNLQEYLGVCCGMDCGIEPLEWSTKWSVNDNHYVEIIPSSNPDSDCSLWDSQTDPLLDDFNTVSVQPLTKDLGQLEEPLSVQSHSTIINDALALPRSILTGEVDCGLSFTTMPITEDVPYLTEEAVFGSDDQDLLVMPEEDKCLALDPSQICREKYDKHIFTQDKAEELMYLVSDEEIQPCTALLSEYGVVSEARNACAEDLIAYPSLPPSEPGCSGTGLQDITDLVKTKQPSEQCIEKLVLSLSPVVKCHQFNFLTLNDPSQDEISKRGYIRTLESPLSLGTSPTQYVPEDMQDVISLKSWSPETATVYSPLLSKQHASKLQAALQQEEMSFGEIQAFILHEPEVEDPRQKSDQQPDPITPALCLVKSAESGNSLEHLELNLSWVITPTEPQSLPLAYPESLSLSLQRQSEQTLELMDFETIEHIVKQEINTTSEDIQYESHNAMGSEERENNANLTHFEENFGSNWNAAFSETKICSHDSQLLSSGAKIDKNCKVTSFSSSAITITDLASQLDPGYLKENHLQKELDSATMRKKLHENLDIPVKNTKRNSPSLLAFKPMATGISIGHCAKLAQQPAALRSQSKGLNRFCCTEEDPQSMVSTHLYKMAETISPDIKCPAPEGFDLQFDFDDFVPSDTIDGDTSPGRPDKQHPDVLPVTLPVDPVDAFLLLRDGTNYNIVKGHTVVKTVQRTENSSKCLPAGVITPMSAVPRDMSKSEQRFVTVSLNGEFLKALQELEQQAKPHLQHLVTEGIMKNDCTFMSLQMDYTHSLLKDSLDKLQCETKDLGKCTDEVVRCLVMVHTLCTAAHLLEHYCLESAIVHLASTKDQYAELTGLLESLRKAFFEHQFKAQQRGELHPKVMAVCREIQHHKQIEASPHKILVVLPLKEPTLLKILQSSINTDGTMTKALTNKDMFNIWPEDCDCILTWDEAVVKMLMPVTTLLVEYQVNHDSPLPKECQSTNIDYVGLCTTQSADQQLLGNQSSIRGMALESNITVVGSQQIVQHQQLLQLLETRYNVIVLRRNFGNVGLIHYPDVVVSLHKGAILVELQQMKGSDGLQQVLERLTAVGLCLSLVWVLIYSVGNTISTLTGDTMKKIAQLQALVACMSAAFKRFKVTYKVLICRSAADVAQYVHCLATTSDVLASDGTDLNASTIHLPPEMSKEEKFLLGIPCLNSFSCQLLLSRATVAEVMAMSLDQLRSLVPELSYATIESMHQIVNLDSGLQLRPLTTDCLSNHGDSLSDDQFSITLVGKEVNGKDDSTLGHSFEDLPSDVPLTNSFERQCLGIRNTMANKDSDLFCPEITRQCFPFLLASSQNNADEGKPLLPLYQKLAESSDYSFAREICQSQPDSINMAKSRTQEQGNLKILSKSLPRRDDWSKKIDVDDEECLWSHNHSFMQPEREQSESFHSNSKPTDSWHQSIRESQSKQKQPMAQDNRNQTDFDDDVSAQAKFSYTFKSTKDKQVFPHTSSLTRSGFIKDLVVRDLHADPNHKKFWPYNLFADDSLSGCSRILSGTKNQETDPANRFIVKPECLQCIPSFDSPDSHQPVEKSSAPSKQDYRYPSSAFQMYKSLEKEQHGSVGHFSSLRDNTSILHPGFFPAIASAAACRAGDESLDSSCRAPSVPRQAADWPVNHSPLLPDSSDNQPTTASHGKIPPHVTNLGYHHSDRFLSETESYGQGSVESSDYLKFSADSAYSDRIPTEPFSYSTHRDKDHEALKAEQLLASNTAQQGINTSFSEDLAATTRKLLQGKSLGFTSSGHRRLRTPSHRISVGLAQPFRREDSSSQDSGPSVKNKQFQISPKLYNQQTSSPPFELQSEEPTEIQHHQISAAKLKKWSTELLYSIIPDTYAEDTQPSTAKKRAV